MKHQSKQTKRKPRKSKVYTIDLCGFHVAEYNSLEEARAKEQGFIHEDDVYHTKIDAWQAILDATKEDLDHNIKQKAEAERWMLADIRGIEKAQAKIRELLTGRRTK